MDPSRDEGLDCCAETLQQVKGQNPSLQHLQHCQVPIEHGDGWETAGVRGERRGQGKTFP